MENLDRLIEELELSVRTSMHLQNAKLEYLGELCQKTEAEVLALMKRNKKSLKELKEILADLGLSLGMQLPDWRRP